MMLDKTFSKNYKITKIHKMVKKSSSTDPTNNNSNTNTPKFLPMDTPWRVSADNQVRTAYTIFEILDHPLHKQSGDLVPLYNFFKKSKKKLNPI